jgi:hypothetical protein
VAVLTRPFLLLVICSFVVLPGNFILAQSGQHTEDLRQRWMVNENGVWKSFAERTTPVNTVYFTIDPLDYSESRISLVGVRPFTVWMNGRLLAEVPGAEISMDVDSLAALSNGSITIAVHAKRALGFLKSSIIAPVKLNDRQVDEMRKSSHLLNFCLLAFFILALFFVGLVRSNPRLTLDYFNVARLFTVQERDESLVMSRIMSSFSILVYCFIVLWASFLLLVIAHFAGTLWIVVNDTAIHGVGDAFLKWGRVAMILFAAVFAKTLLVLLLSRIFNIREGAAIQLLNFFRLLAAMVMILSIILVLFFVFETVSPSYYFTLINLVTWIFGLWAVLIFIKLLSKSPFTLFHLISYLCASEFFPIIIVLRVLFF